MNARFLAATVLSFSSCLDVASAGGWGNGPSFEQMEKDLNQAQKNIQDAVNTVTPFVKGAAQGIIQGGVKQMTTPGPTSMPADKEQTDESDEAAVAKADSSGDQAAASASNELPNEGRATTFFGAFGEAFGKSAGAWITFGMAHEAGNLSTSQSAGAAIAASAAQVDTIFEKGGRAAGEAIGRKVDSAVDLYRRETGYDSRSDPRFNPLGLND